jgi:hypothetical protein
MLSWADRAAADPAVANAEGHALGLGEVDLERVRVHARLGFGRIVGSEIEVPNMLGNLIIRVNER